MSGKTFLDTNVLLYAVGDDAAKQAIAEALLVEGGVISVQVLNEFAAVAKRKLGKDWSDIAEALSAIRAMPLRVAPLTLAIHDRALGLAPTEQLNIYDASIVAAALEAGCTTLASEDLQNGRRYGALTVCNPFGTNL